VLHSSILRRVAPGSVAFVLVASAAAHARAEGATISGASGASGAAAPSDPAPRILAGVGLGLVGGLAGFALGFEATEVLTRGGVGGGDCGDACGVDRLGWAVLGGVLVGTAGASLGTYAGSEWVGGDGSLGWTLVGGFVGSAAALGIALVETRAEAPGDVVVVTLIATPIFGAVLGYELSGRHGEQGVLGNTASSESAGSELAGSQAGGSATLGLIPIAGGAQIGVRGAF
jgi:hypothetical protein